MKMKSVAILVVALLVGFSAHAEWWGVFEQPNQQGAMAFTLQPDNIGVQDRSKFFELFLDWQGSIKSNADIAQIGIAGPSGWPPNATEVVSWDGSFPIHINTMWEPWKANHFRGTIFAVSKTGEVAYVDLTKLRCWFGANGAIIKDDGAGSLIIDFSASDYVVGFELSFAITGQGSISTQPMAPLYSADSGVILTATATDGWEFNHWSGSLTGSVNPATIVMDGNKQVTAVFAQSTPASRYALKAIAIGRGTITLDPAPGNDGKYTAGAVVTITAVGDTGWHFDRLEPEWANQSVVVDKDKEVFVVFNPDLPLQPQPADINGDHKVNAIDIQLVINAALGIM